MKETDRPKVPMKLALQIMQDICDKTVRANGFEHPVTIAAFEVLEETEQEYYQHKPDCPTEGGAICKSG